MPPERTPRFLLARSHCVPERGSPFSELAWVYSNARLFRTEMPLRTASSLRWYLEVKPLA